MFFFTLIKRQNYISFKKLEHFINSVVIPRSTCSFTCQPILCLPRSVFFFFFLTVQMLGMMSRNLMNMSVIVVLMAVGFRCSRCAEKLKPCRANIWSPFHTWMSQHNQRNPLDLFQTFLASVCVCCWGK